MQLLGPLDTQVEAMKAKDWKFVQSITQNTNEDLPQCTQKILEDSLNDYYYYY